MIPVSLSISGFLSYKDPAEIDFTGFDLACISGQNGAGKSSILDAMTWALFGRARKHDESIINLESETAQVTLTFEYEGNLYRVMRTNPRGKTTALEFHISENGAVGNAGNWKPLTESSMRETDQRISDTLRLDYETFINAAFFLQGDADQFTQHNPSDRKRILSQILNLGIWEGYRKKAFQSRRNIESEISHMDGRTSEIRLELEQEENRKEQLAELEKRLSNVLEKWLDGADPTLPTILTAHASIEGAVYGGERTVLLGKDFILPKPMVVDPRLDYVAMGHIHKSQNLNKDNHPPVVYSGSIERVDFGEVKDDKFFVLADVEKGKTDLDWRKLKDIRPFHDRSLELTSQKDITDQIMRALPAQDVMKDAVVRLVLEYPRAWAPLIDEKAIQEYASGAFEFHFVKRPQMDERIRLPQDQTVGDLTPSELLERFWQASHVSEEDVEALQELAASIITGEEVEETEQEETVAEEEAEEEEVVPAQ